MALSRLRRRDGTFLPQAVVDAASGELWTDPSTDLLSEDALTVSGAVDFDSTQIGMGCYVSSYLILSHS